MTLPYGRDALRGRIAVVAGATRGAGRGIQQSVSSGELARVYGFTDVDGTSPDIWRKMEESEGT